MMQWNTPLYDICLGTVTSWEKTAVLRPADFSEMANNQSREKVDYSKGEITVFSYFNLQKL